MSTVSASNGSCTTPSHVLDQDGEMQFAAAGDAEHVGIRGLFDAQGNVALELAHEAFADLAAGDELAFLAGERRGVHLEAHDERWLIHRDRRQRIRLVHVADRVADVHVLDAGHGDDVARDGFVHGLARQALEREHLLHLRDAVVFRAIPQLDLLAGLDRAATDAADADASDIRVVVERGDLELQRRFRLALGSRHVVQDGFVKRAHVGLAAHVIRAGPAFEGGGVDHREIELAIAGAELVEQFEGLVDDPVGARARTVDLVHHDDGIEAERQRLARDEARLRHRAFDRVDHQQHRVDHREDAFHFAAKVGVPGGVDNIDARAAVLDGAVLREDRDATFLFDVVRVHHPLGDFLVRGESAGLAQQAVHQGGLAMVDVRNDGDVSNRAICHGTQGLARGMGSAGRAKGARRVPERMGTFLISKEMGTRLNKGQRGGSVSARGTSPFPGK
jgi:hypothetical protein